MNSWPFAKMRTERKHNVFCVFWAKIWGSSVSVAGTIQWINVNKQREKIYPCAWIIHDDHYWDAICRVENSAKLQQIDQPYGQWNPICRYAIQCDRRFVVNNVWAWQSALCWEFFFPIWKSFSSNWSDIQTLDISLAHFAPFLTRLVWSLCDQNSFLA